LPTGRQAGQALFSKACPAQTGGVPPITGGPARRFVRRGGVLQLECVICQGIVFNSNVIGKNKMEKIINIHVEKLPEGYYLATSEDVQGLVAQGRTIIETLEIARDVVKKLLEAQIDTIGNIKGLIDTDINFDYPLVIGI
jgi:predicted RNase H-like HicB family nuclease